MKFFTVAALSAFAGVAVANPFGPPKWTQPLHPTPTPKTTTKAAAPTTSGHAVTSSAPHYTSTSTTSTYSTSTTSTAAHGTVSCLTDASASYLVNGFGKLLTAYTTADAEALLASDFTDTSDSINFLAGYPAGSVTFPSKAAFEAGQGSQPAIGFQVYSIDAVTCKVIAFRWAALLGGSPIKGINIIYASNLNGTDAGWQIETNYSEFNSGLWTQEIGGTCVPPSQA